MASGPPGRELGVILEGEGKLEYGDKEYYLKQADSISFSSNIPHKMINIGNVNLKAIWISTPPRMEYLREHL